MQRTAGILFGVLTHALFAVTVWHLFWFLKGAEQATLSARGAAEVPAAAIDACLAVLS